MKNINDFIPLADVLVNELSKQINYNEIDLKQAEEKILRFIYKIGHLLLDEVIHNIKEPTYENRIIVDGKEAIYRDMQNLHFKNRFGEIIERQRRSYKLKDDKGGYYPLDEKLGLDICAGYSPLMTYLLSYFGGCEPYKAASKKLNEALGFTVSSTAVQNNSELI